MIKPAIPSNEARRIQTLRNMRLLDTPPEERFDRVTRLAKQVFATPIALVSLVDADRQWFKSRQGLDAEETPRDISFCGHAILDDKIMVINNAPEDQRFCDNPLVCGDPNIRFYAGYPLAAPDGSRVGTLCIIDSKPREMSPEQLSLLRELGRMIEEEMITADASTSDPVTGLSNRNGMFAIADHLISMCKRTDQPATLLLFHVQNLHDIEEKNGRPEGDAVAVEVSHLLMACFRNSDVVARLSHDTFCVLLAGSNLDGVETARYRFEERLSTRNRECSEKDELHIDTQAVTFKEGRHADAEALVQDAEVRILEDQEVAEAGGIANAS